MNNLSKLFECFQCTPRYSIILIYLAILIDNLLLTSVVPVIPDYLNKLMDNSSDTDENGRLGFLLSTKAFVQFFCNFFVSPLINRFGYEVIQITGSVILLLSSLMYLMGESFIMLLIPRCIQGIASAFITVSGMAMIANMYPKQETRSAVMGFALGGMAVGVLIGYPFGGFLYEFMGKSAPFAIIALLTVLLIVAQLTTFNWSVRYGSFLYDIPVLNIISDKYIIVSIGMIAVSTTSMSILESCLPLWLIETMDPKPKKWQLGTVFIPDSIGYLIGTNFLISCFAYKCKRWITAMISLALVGLSALTIPLASNMNHLIIPHFGLGLGIGTIDAAIMPFLANIVDTKYFTLYGSVYAIAQTAVCLAYSLGPLISGQLIQLGVDFSTLIRAVGLMNLMYCPLCLILRHFENYEYDSEKVSMKVQKNLNTGKSSTTSRSNGAYAENIKCNKDIDEEYFNAIVTLPTGFGTVPVFNEASNVNPSISDQCVIKQTSIGSNKFLVKIQDLESCGVQTQKAADGAVWMSVSLRFPLIGSLRTAEDEVITLMCRPRERIIVRNHVLDIKSQIQNPLRTVFSSSPLDFDCNLDVYLKSDNENSFSRMIPTEDVIEVGQEVQLRATIRSGDGWKYAMIKDVTIHKMIPQSPSGGLSSFSTLSSLRQTSSTAANERDSTDSNVNRFFTNALNIRKPAPSRFSKTTDDSNNRTIRQKRQIPDAAFLVLSDGCRNPVYRSIASTHPVQESNDNLVVSFNFKAFMFQDMDESGTIRITAKVIACVEEEDCQPMRCIDDDQIGYGRRRRRRKRSLNMTTTDNILESIDNNNSSQTSDYSKELQLKIVMPSVKTAVVNSDVQSVLNEWFGQTDGRQDCRYVVYFMGTLALVFCLTITMASSVVIIKSKQTKY
ncbi:uncharacterized protein LOC128964158 [Oppia nitens]|uniref:uncharacterized protein LOC128964158 n=1 Tax=Oppia nitens TaxID=1686743 RepID=UPI0023DA1B4D|nr:uncharacterized protein LOC128964158 [Oppia nitens]